MFKTLFGFFSIIMIGKVYSTTLFTGNGSYNSFRQQVGFCKLQGFDTVSRNTSRGPPLFTSERVQMGVGLSHIQFGHNISNCGRCLLVHQAKNLVALNPSLTLWEGQDPPSFPFYAMVMDECKDPVCTSGYLDFDIYNPMQPVAHGNPFDIVWEFADCPVMPDHGVEFLFCFSSTCKENDPEDRIIRDILHQASPIYFWTVFVRNTVVPVYRIRILPSGIDLDPREGWTWDKNAFSFEDGLLLELNDRFVFPFDFSRILDQTTTPGYRGGVLFTFQQQIL